MTAFFRNLTAFVRAFFVAAVLVMLPASLALAQEDGSRPATKADILRLGEEGKRRDANIAELTKNMAVLAEKMSGLSDKIDAQSQQFHDALNMQAKRMDNMQTRMDNMQGTLNNIFYSIIGGLFILVGGSFWFRRESKPAATPAMSAESVKSREVATGAASIVEAAVALTAIVMSTASSQGEKNLPERYRRPNRNHLQ